MKAILSAFSLSLLMLIIGYVAGQAGLTRSTTRQMVEERHTDTPAQMQAEKETETPTQTKNTPIQIAFPTGEDQINHTARLMASSAKERLDALYIIWREQTVDQYQSDIETLANEDPDLQVLSLAQWILGETPEMEATEPRLPEITLSDINSPEQQIQASLTLDPFQYKQLSSQPDSDRDWLQGIHSLTQEEQLAYIKELTEADDDAAVNALNELVLDYDPALKNAAIDGLLSILEMRTGHFNIIAQRLKQNVVYLSEVQKTRFRELTQEDKNN